jgi:hypothetical protein
MKRFTEWGTGLLLVGLVSCTSLSEGQDNASLQAPVADRRVRLRGNANASLYERLDFKASEINRKRNIEEFDRNGPAMTPTLLRPKLLPYAPIDTVQHNIHRPVNTQVKPLGSKNH